jgi:hypothetical protein
MTFWKVQGHEIHNSRVQPLSSAAVDHRGREVGGDYIELSVTKERAVLSGARPDL